MALILLAQIVCSAPVLRWSKRFGGDIDSSPVLSDDRKTLYLGSYDHILYALDTATGSVRWKYTAGLEYYIIDRSTPVLSKDGHVIYAASMVGAGNGNLYAIRAIDGVPLWNVTLNAEGGMLLAPPAVGAEGDVLYTAGQDGKVYAVHAGSGKLEWTAQCGAREINGRPAVSRDGRSIYVGSMDANLYALDRSGKLQWSHATGDGIPTSATVSASGDLVYFSSNDGYLYAVHAADGQLRWKYLAPEDRELPGPPIHAFTQPILSRDGRAVIAGNGMGEAGDGRVFWLDAHNGTALHRSHKVGSLSATPVLSRQGGEVYIGSDAFFTDELYAFSTVDGSTLWSYKIDTLPTEVVGSVAVDGDGGLYFGNAAGVFFALDI